MEPIVLPLSVPEFGRRTTTRHRKRVSFHPNRAIWIFIATFLVSFVEHLPTTSIPTSLNLYEALILAIPVAAIGAFGQYVKTEPSATETT